MKKTLVDISAAQRAELGAITSAQTKKLAAEIRRRRVLAGITWQAMADACGVTIGAAQSWGSGVRVSEKKHLAALDKLFK